MCGEEVATCPSCSLIIKVSLVFMVIVVYVVIVVFMVIEVFMIILVFMVTLVFLGILVVLTLILTHYVKVIYDSEDFQDEEEAPSVATKLEALKL